MLSVLEGSNRRSAVPCVCLPVWLWCTIHLLNIAANPHPQVLSAWSNLQFAFCRGLYVTNKTHVSLKMHCWCWCLDPWEYRTIMYCKAPVDHTWHAFGIVCHTNEKQAEQEMSEHKRIHAYMHTCIHAYIHNHTCIRMWLQKQNLAGALAHSRICVVCYVRHISRLLTYAHFLNTL